MSIPQSQAVCVMWLAARPRGALTGCSTSWRLMAGWSKRSLVVVIGDGAPWIWHLAAEHFPGAVQIVDLYHAKEHVWDVAHAIFGTGTAAGTAWAPHACSLLEQGQSEDLLFPVQALPPVPPEPGEARGCPERARDFLTTN